MAKRIYNVYELDGAQKTMGVLVRAPSKQAAITHVIRHLWAADIADQETIIRLMRLGAKVEDVGEEAGEE